MSRLTIHDLLKAKQSGKKIAALTAYDATFARILDEAGIDLILVGDSAANVIAGYETTHPIGMREMIYHTKAVVRATRRAFVVMDMPFGSYQISVAQAVRNAIYAVKATGVQAVKLEGGQEIAPIIEAILRAGIPVMGHLGLLPQSVHKLGGYRLQGKTQSEAQQLIEDARHLEQLGCFAIVLEKIPAKVARQITEAVRIPTIGIGAGPHTDGQILVLYDMLGLNPAFRPRFVRTFANLHTIVSKAVQEYCTAVRQNQFPAHGEYYDTDTN